MTTHVERSIVITRNRLSDGTECFIAEDPSLPGCITYGKTEDEAMEMLDDARRAYLRVVPRAGEDR